MRSAKVLLHRLGDFKPATCNSLLGAEGRCIPECVGAVSGQAQFLPRVGCADGEVCAPCYNPGDGSLTGACGINGDAPTRNAVLFDTCCGTSGRCVPEDVVPENFRGALKPETCSTSEGPRLCAPLSQIVGSAAGSDTCTFAGTYGLPGPGICFDPCTVPDFSFLPQEECAVGSVCLPCFNLDGTPTGACDPNTPMPALQSMSSAEADASR